jgi:phosphate transport system protein
MTTPLSQPVTPHFFDDLAVLKQELVREGELVATRLSSAMKGLVEQDLDRLDEVAIADADVNAMQMAIDDRAFKLLALHQPVATDLRMIVAAIKINADLERIGDLAVNIAERALELNQEPPLKPYIDVPRMSAAVATMVHNALDAFVNRSADQARAVLDADDEVDKLNVQLFRELLTYMIEEPRNVSRAMRITFIAKYLERIGDHATNIAQMVIFMCEGRDVRHPRLKRNSGGTGQT